MVDNVPTTKTGFLAWIQVHAFALICGAVIGFAGGVFKGALFGL